MAHELTGQLKERYGDRLVAVMLEGSTAKGYDRPESDLELGVVLIDGKDRWYPFFRRGMFIGISYKSLASESAAAETIDYTWPVAGDALHHGVVLYDPGGLYPRLRDLNLQALARTDFGELVRDALADMYENVLKLATLKPHEEPAARVSAAGAAHWAALTVALANRHRYPSTRRMFEDSFELASLPEGYPELMRKLLSGDTVDGLQDTLGCLWPAFVAWAAGIGVSLEDEGVGI